MPKATRSIQAVASNLRVGDLFRVNTPRMSHRGEITKVNRTTFDWKSPYFDTFVEGRSPISNLAGGQLQRNGKIMEIK